MTLWYRIPPEVVDLFRRVKGLEHGDSSWPGADTVNTLATWFAEQGIDPDTPAGQVPEPDPPHTYRRAVTVSVASWPELDEADLDHAIYAAVIGTGVRVELADTMETTWVELDCDMVRLCGPLDAVPVADLAALRDRVGEWVRDRAAAERDSSGEDLSASDRHDSDGEATAIVRVVAGLLGLG